MDTRMHVVNLSHPLELISHPLDGQILEVLSGADAQFTGRQVHSLLRKRSPRGVRLSLDRLCRQGIVSAEMAGRATLYRLNRSHLAAAHVLALAHLRYEFIRRLRAAFASWDPQPAVAYLFGSSARRESNAASDVDICIIRPTSVDDPDRPDWRQQIDAISRDVSSWTGNDTRILEFAETEVLDRLDSDPVLTSIREDGVCVAGDAELLRHQRRSLEP